jgi:antitoxin MazE
MRTAVRKMGNSSGVIIPKPILKQLGVEAGDDLDMSLDKDKIVLALIKQNPRAGWSAAAREIARHNDDALVWPEFGNIDDETFTW